MAAGSAVDAASLRAFLEAKRPKASAEMSVLDELGVLKDDHAYFICSDSDDSVLCGQVMADYYTEVHHCVDGPITLDQVDEEEIRAIFQRMQNWRAVIREIRLRYMEAGHAPEPHLEYKKKGPGYLRYHANTPRGTQALDIVVDEGQEEYVLKQLGKKIYA